MKFNKFCYMLLYNDETIIYNNLNLNNINKYNLVSISNLVKPTIPDYWFYPWVRDIEQPSLLSLRNRWINDGQHKKALEYIDDLVDKKKFIWPNMFIELSDIMYFKKTYISDKDDVTLVCVALSEDYYSEFFSSEDTDTDGVLSHISKEEIDGYANNLLGYDICGWSNSNFYSFILNGLQLDFSKYDVKLNSNNLVENFKDAKKIINLIETEEIQAEEINWYPWLVRRVENN